MSLRRALRADWDAIAGIIAAIAALVMHYLHVVEEGVLLTITVVLLALLFIRDLRRDRQSEEAGERLRGIEASVRHVRESVKTPDALLVGPLDLRTESQRFCERAQGEMTWFHVCLLMFRTQELFDILLGTAIDNPRVTTIRFTLDPDQRELWRDHVLPKVQRCSGAPKVLEPQWVEIDETVSFIRFGTKGAGGGECLLSFWGEPFMSSRFDQSVPRFVFNVQPHSELVTHLAEMERKYRLRAPPAASVTPG